VVEGETPEPPCAPSSSCPSSPGCLTPSSFQAQQSKVICDRQEECERTVFEATYDDPKECRDDYDALLGGVWAARSRPAASTRRARPSCLKALKTASCTELTTGAALGDCEDVYEECDFAELAICFALNGVSFDTGF
jgi:hypothetical protein